MEIDICLGKGFTNLTNWLNDTCFTVDMHNRYQKGGILYPAQYIGGLNPAGGIRSHKINFTAHALKTLHGFQYGLMLDACCDEMGTASLFCMLVEP